MAQTLALADIGVGETRTLTISSLLKSDRSVKNPTSATIVMWDPEQPVEGTADSGSTTTLVDATRTEANDYFNGLFVEVTDATNGYREQTRITDFDHTTGTLTFGALSFAVAAGDTYKIVGTPIVTQQAATVSTNETSWTVSPSDATSRPRSLKGYAVVTFSASDIVTCLLTLDVVPTMPE